MKSVKKALVRIPPTYRSRHNLCILSDGAEPRINCVTSSRTTSVDESNYADEIYREAKMAHRGVE